MLSAQILFLSASMDGCRLFGHVVLLTMVVGIQDQQCQVGFYGSSCQHPCPMTCNNQQCNIDKVGRTVCIHGCVGGYRGTSCRIPCPENCQVCERVNGSCINCKATFHGTNCTLTCGELCKGFRCDTAQTCSKTTCLDGRYGQNCSNTCFPRCLTCARSTGNCTACRDGYYGQFCELDCPRCGFSDGSVDQTCKDGCNTISCSDITGGDYGRNIGLTVFVPVVLLMVIAIAAILCLWWRSHNKIIRKKRETDEEVQQRMPEEKHTKSRKKRETEEEVQERMLEGKHTKRASDPYSHAADSSTDYGYHSTTTSQDMLSRDESTSTTTVDRFRVTPYRVSFRRFQGRRSGGISFIYTDNEACDGRDVIKEDVA